MAYDYSKLLGRITEKFGTQARFSGAMGMSERSLSLKGVERMAYYRTCPLCGSNNDPGEACDCRAETKKESAPAQRERTQANGYPYTVYQPGRAASRTKEVRPWLKS